MKKLRYVAVLAWSFFCYKTLRSKTPLNSGGWLFCWLYGESTYWRYQISFVEFCEMKCSKAENNA